MFQCSRSISPSVTSKLSRKSSSNLTKARASCKKWNGATPVYLSLIGQCMDFVAYLTYIKNELSAFFHMTYFNLKSENESSDKICCFCEWANVLCLLTRLNAAQHERLSKRMCIYSRKMPQPCHSTHFDFHISGLEVESNLELKVFYNWRENLEPIFFQRCVSVCWNCYFSHLIRPLQTHRRQ